MKRFGKVRIHIARLLGGAGAIMALITIGALLDYHEASERYWQRAEPIMERLTDMDHSPAQSADRDTLIRLFQTKLTPQEFNQHVALINRTYNDYGIRLGSEERFALWSELSFLRSSKEDRFILKHANILLFGGFALVALGAFLERKKEPKPEAPPPPRQPWETVPSPAIAKGNSSAPEHSGSKLGV